MNNLVTHHFGNLGKLRSLPRLLAFFYYLKSVCTYHLTLTVQFSTWFLASSESPCHIRTRTGTEMVTHKKAVGPGQVCQSPNTVSKHTYLLPYRRIRSVRSAKRRMVYQTTSWFSRPPLGIVMAEYQYNSYLLYYNSPPDSVSERQTRGGAEPRKGEGR